MSTLDLFKGTSVADDLRSLKSLEVVLVIDDLRVISFDRFGMKMPSSVAFDDTVRVHLGYLRQFLIKQILLKPHEDFEMPSVSTLPQVTSVLENDLRPQAAKQAQ